MARQTLLTVSQARSLLRPRKSSKRRGSPGLLQVLLPMAVGLEISDRKLGGPGLIEEVKRGNAMTLVTRVLPYSLAGYDNETGRFDPIGAVMNFYLPAFLTSWGLKMVKQRFTGGRGFRALGVKWL